MYFYSQSIYSVNTTMQEKTTEDQYLINDKKKTKMEIRSVAR